MYDVAFSFLTTDLALAEQLKGELSPLDCFVYSRNQEAIAGTDGLDTFRTVFRSESRTNVVLFRAGWGNTPWTGIEEVAIKESCLATKYESLIFVRCDNSTTPSWLPDTHQLFDFTLYSTEQLVGVIKSRAQRLGSIVRPESAVEKAQRIAQAEISARDARQFLDSLEGVDAARQSFQEIKDALEAQTQAIAAEHPNWKSRFGAGSPWDYDFFFAGVRLTVNFIHFANSVRDCSITAEFSLLRNDLYRRVESDPIEVTFKQSRGICWKPANERAISPPDVADRWLNKMLEIRQR